MSEKTDGKSTERVTRKLDDLVRCGSCKNFKQKTKYNNPPIGDCVAEFKMPVAFMREHLMIFSTTNADSCEFYTPNVTGELPRIGK